MSNLGKILATCLLLLAISAGAKERQDSTYIFRFVPRNDMFYVPWHGNGDQLDSLLKEIDQNRAAIDAGQMYLLVTSHGISGNAGEGAGDLAKTCRNRVKSELIIRGRISENNFITDRIYSEPYRSGDGTLKYVVTVTLPAPVEKVAEIAGEEAARKVQEYMDSLSPDTAIDSEADDEADKEGYEETVPESVEKSAETEMPEEGLTSPEDEEEQRHTPSGTPSETKAPTDYHLSLRANLLRWATLTPDLGLEWRICPSWGIAVNGSWTSWTWNGNDRRYALWEVAPEVRWYLGEKKAWYVGAMFKAGQFNYKLCGTGKQGDLIGGGVIGGYQLRLNKALALDFNLGLGYLNADYEKYEVIDGVRVRRGNGTKDWWGPVNAGVTLVWKLF